jgi:hypothetical protein
MLVNHEFTPYKYEYTHKHITIIRDSELLTGMNTPLGLEFDERKNPLVLRMTFDDIEVGVARVILRI